MTVALVVGPDGVVDHLKNALQILSVTRPVDQSPHEVEKNLLAAEARIMKAIALLAGK